MSIQRIYDDWMIAKREDNLIEATRLQKAFIETACEVDDVASLSSQLREEVRKAKIQQLEHAYEEWTSVLYRMTEVPVTQLAATQLILAPELLKKQARYLDIHQKLFVQDY